MKAALLYGSEDLRVEEVEVPIPGSGEVRVRVRGAQVCGTDIRIYRNGAGNVSTDSPLILGHELSGLIDEVGPGVEGYRPGMRVAVAPNMGCGICDICVSGNTHLCPRYRALGVTMPGGFAEYVLVPEAAVRQGNLVEIPESIGFQEAALAEPLSCVYNAFDRLQMQPGATVVIIGAGPIGIMHARVHRAAGAALVVVSDVNPERLKLCRSLEPSVSAVEAGDLPRAVEELTDGRGADVCVTACAAPEAQQVSLELSAVNGKVLFFGGLPPSKSKVVLDTNLIHYKQLWVTGTTRQSLSQYRKTLRLLSQGLVTLAGLVTSTWNLVEIREAFENALGGRGLKSAVIPGAEAPGAEAPGAAAPGAAAPGDAVRGE
jgi:L-iditol 2-dehydrogenase